MTTLIAESGVFGRGELGVRCAPGTLELVVLFKTPAGESLITARSVERTKDFFGLRVTTQSGEVFVFRVVSKERPR